MKSALTLLAVLTFPLALLVMRLIEARVGYQPVARQGGGGRDGRTIERPPYATRDWRRP
jgi:hypothetical protein